MDYFIPPTDIIFQLCVQTLAEVGYCCVNVFWIMLDKYYQIDCVSGFNQHFESYITKARKYRKEGETEE